MSLNPKPGGVLGVWTEAAPQGEADFNEWYNREHMNERCDVAGFVNGRRYRAVSGAPRYMALYDLRDAGVLASPAYREALDDPSPWTRRIMPHFAGIIRSEFHVRYEAGRGFGAAAFSVRAITRGMPQTGFADWLASDALPAVIEQPGIVNARYLETTHRGEARTNTESHLRPQKDQIADWAVIVEGADIAAVRAACRDRLSRTALRSNGSGRSFAIGTYRLICATQG